MNIDLIERPSPNFDDRQADIELVVLHYTGMQNADIALQRLTDPNPRAGAYPGPWQDPDINPDTSLPRVSAHYVVDEVGLIFALVPEDKRAWHAGVSSWQGEGGVNDRSIGVEIVNGGHDFGLPPYTQAQIRAVIVLVKDICRRYRLGPQHVVGHSDVAPGRKLDPGEHFPWVELADAGLSLWPLAPPRPGGAEALRPGESGKEVRALQAALAAIGYRTPEHGGYDDETLIAVAAFQRRYRPALVDGVVDAETLALIIDIDEQKHRLSQHLN